MSEVVARLKFVDDLGTKELLNDLRKTHADIAEMVKEREQTQSRLTIAKRELAEVEARVSVEALETLNGQKSNEQERKARLSLALYDNSAWVAQTATVNALESTLTQQTNAIEEEKQQARIIERWIDYQTAVLGFVR